MKYLYTLADMAAAWESGYWHGTTHTGPLNDAAVKSKNPYRWDEEIVAKLHLDDDSEIHLRAGLEVHATGGGCE